MSPDQLQQYKEEMRDEREAIKAIKTLTAHKRTVGLFGVITLKGVSIKATGDGWKLVARVTVEGQHFVTFIEHSYIVEGLAQLLRGLDSNQLTLYKDRFTA